MECHLIFFIQNRIKICIEIEIVGFSSVPPDTWQPCTCFVAIYSPHGHVPLDTFIYSPELRLNFSQEINSLSWILGLLYLISRKLYSFWVKKMSMIWLHWLQITEGLVSGKQRFPLCFSILTEDEVF